MQEISTPKSTPKAGTLAKLGGKPKKTTIEFLRQFARCYAPQPGLPSPLADIVAN